VPTEEINLIHDRRSSSALAVQAYSRTQVKNAIRDRTFVYLDAAARRQWQKSECENARSCERGIIARHYFRNFILAEVDVWRSARFERRGPSLLTDSEGLLYLSLVRVCVCVIPFERTDGGSTAGLFLILSKLL
jgi:hypothetical protein